MKTVIIIPSRFASTRYPGKSLVVLNGPDGAKTLIQRSWEAASAVSGVSAVYVATDDDRIREAAEAFGAKVLMTPSSCTNGTERCAAALDVMDWEPDLVVNLQGDAPLTPAWFVSDLIAAFEKDPSVHVTTPVLRCDLQTYRNFIEDRKHGRVGGTTAVFDAHMNAMYFSKEVIPYVGAELAEGDEIPVFHHVGVYAYRPKALREYADWTAGPLEILEGLEQLRFMEHGIPVCCVEVEGRGRVFWELNNPEDVPRIEAALNERIIVMKTVEAGNLKISNTMPFTLLAGPCQLESLDHARMLCERTLDACTTTNTPFVFKASYDKANRTSLKGMRGLGMEKGLEILAAIKDEFGVPVVTDVHEIWHCAKAAEVVDILQIPAFLSRQTDLLLAAGETGKCINIKKGQFLAPNDMKNVAEKVASTGNDNIMLCDRGTSFGYNMLVSDFRCIPIMAETGYPIVFDATHSVQMPGGQGASSGGKREFVPPLATAAAAIGVAAIFIETHEDPDNAPSDGPNMIPVDQMRALIEKLSAHDRLAKGL